MATMNISLPDKMKEWVETQVATGRYANASDYMRDLLRRDEERNQAISELQHEIDKGIASGISSRSREELIDYVRSSAERFIRERGGSKELAGSRR